jgi:Glu-tRNA(Gln) amidotransferase subunit E-like FAD-binding protein
MNNEAVAWIDPKELDMDVSTSVTKNKQFDTDIPLYTNPKKYCPSENNQAYEKGFIDGMAKQRDSKVQQFVEGYTHPVKELTAQEVMEQTHKKISETHWQVKELTDEEIEGIARANVDGHSSMEQLKWFARAILRKAQEK